MKHRHVSEHQKPDYPDHPAPGGGNYEGHQRQHKQYPKKEELPFQPAQGGASTKRPGIRERLRERFREHPATKEEIMQLELDTRREQLKSQKYTYKHQRSNAFERIVGGGQRQARPSRGYATPRSRPQGRMGSSLLESNNVSFGYTPGRSQSSWQGTGLNSLLGSGNPMLGPKKYSKREQPKPFASGLDSLFSIK